MWHMARSLQRSRAAEAGTSAEPLPRATHPNDTSVQLPLRKILEKRQAIAVIAVTNIHIRAGQMHLVLSRILPGKLCLQLSSDPNLCAPPRLCAVLSSGTREDSQGGEGFPRLQTCTYALRTEPRCHGACPGCCQPNLNGVSLFGGSGHF